MPIISRIASRNWRVRALYGAIFAVLIIGAVTMLYPFALMLAGSVKSEADAFLITPYPEFWFDDAMLFRKYAEAKHNAALDICRQTWNQSLPNWRFVAPPPPMPEEARRDFLAWRATPAARDMGILGHTTGARLLPHNARRYRRRMHARCDGDLSRYREFSGSMAASWASVAPPSERVGRYRHTGLPERHHPRHRRANREVSVAGSPARPSSSARRTAAWGSAGHIRLFIALSRLPLRHTRSPRG